MSGVPRRGYKGRLLRPHRLELGLTRSCLRVVALSKGGRMSPYFEQIRLYGLELRKERMREADQWRLSCASVHPTWLARQGCRLLCRLGGQLIRAGQYLQTSYESRSPLNA
jgi:hypothetical protein